MELWALFTLGWRLELLNLWGLVGGLAPGARRATTCGGSISGRDIEMRLDESVSLLVLPGLGLEPLRWSFPACR